MVALSAPMVSRGAPVEAAPEDGPTASPVAVQRVAFPASGIRDEAAMVLVGSVLIGLAAAVRRTA
jgi:hypothetical protein